jgi:hypothetical protein
MHKDVIGLCESLSRTEAMRNLGSELNGSKDKFITIQNSFIYLSPIHIRVCACLLQTHSHTERTIL